MTRLTLATAIAAALAFAATSAPAQTQQGEPDQKGGSPSRTQAQDQQQGRPTQEQTQQKKQEAGPQGTEKAGPKGPSTKGAQATPKDETQKGTAVKGLEPKERGTKGTAEKSEPQGNKAPKGTAEKSEPQGTAPKGTAEKSEPQGKAPKGAIQTSPEKGKGTAQGPAGRVQISDQQRTSVSQTLLKEQRVNRVTNVNISVNVGTRVPRSVHLAALPATVVAIVPAYRSYRYFVVEERIVIVDPASYEVVDIIEVSDRTARTGERGGTVMLVLTEEERSIILREVDMSGGSTLGLGAMTEGSDVPRGVELHAFPATVVQKVQKLRGYKFFTAENRLAIVDPQGARVQLVIGEQR
jgi:hypothetical protein